MEEEESKLQVQEDILATKKALVKARQKLEKALEAYPIDTSVIFQAETEVESLEDGKSKLEDLLKKLF